MSKIIKHIILLSAAFLVAGCSGNLSQVVIFEDEFDQLPTGVLSSSLGSLSEVYFIPDAGQKGQWTIASYGKEKGYQKAWETVEIDGENVLRQNFRNLGANWEQQSRFFHPAIVGGDSIWNNYSIRFSFKPYEQIDKCGILFRYQNNRCYYFFGMEGNMLMLKLVQHATSPFRPYEKILASQNFNWEKGTEYEGFVTLRDERIYAQVNDSINLVATDNSIKNGKIGLLSDVKADFKLVEVSTLKSERRKMNKYKSQIASQMALRLSENPSAVLLQTIPIDGFGSGNSMRFGDLNSDGVEDILIAQTKNKKQEASLVCLTAITIKGDVLWQNGSKQSEDQRNVIDFPFQVHDFDGDGSKEIVYLSGESIYVLNGESGRRIRKVKMPDTSGQKDGDSLGEKFIFFCDLSGKGRDGNMIVFDGNNMLYAFDDRIRLLWSQKVEGASFPAAKDIDKDGKDEIATGYALLDDTGAYIWNVSNQYGSKVNEIAMLALHPEADSIISIVIAAGNWGTIVLDQSGELIRHHPVGYVRNLSVGNFRNDLDGLEIITSNFWGNQGLIHFYNSDGIIYNSFEPGPHSSKCIPVNWMGNGEDYFVLNASSGDGGLYNGNSQLVLVLPDDGHPELCHAVMDISGDSRDEIIVWDQYSIWIYTQSDSPRKGELNQSIRSELYNSSIYQSMVSLPDWE